MTHQETMRTGPDAVGDAHRLVVGPPSERELPADLARLVAFTEPELDLEDVCLEVPCGDGRLALALSRRVRHITALDTDEDRLEDGKHAADRSAITNVTFSHGDAAYLPYLSRSFTLVISAFVLHRLGDPAAALRQLTRVCRPGAGLIVADIVRAETDAKTDAEVGAEVGAETGTETGADRIERLRDDEHVRLLTTDQIAGLMAEAGAEVKRSETFEVVRPVESWLAAARTPGDVAERIRSRLTAEIDGGPATGLRPALVDGALTVTHVHAHLMAVAS